MLIEESRRRQEELEARILEMALKPLEDTDLKNIAVKLKGLYTDDFRHNYSGFYPLIIDVAKDENDYNLDYLSENIENLRALVEIDVLNGEKEFKGLYMPLSKLSDHLNLEIARYHQYSKTEDETKTLVKRNTDLQKTLEEARKALKIAETALEDSKNRAASLQTEYTTILGIFAAIILAFTGTITFSTSVLQYIHQASIYRLLLMTMLIGFVAINLIAHLTEFIVKLNIKHAPQQMQNETVKEDCFISRNWKILLINAVLIIGILLTCVAYQYDWFNRETHITKIQQEQQAQDIPSAVNEKQNDSKERKW